MDARVLPIHQNLVDIILVGIEELEQSNGVYLVATHVSRVMEALFRSLDCLELASFRFAFLDQARVDAVRVVDGLVDEVEFQRSVGPLVDCSDFAAGEVPGSNLLYCALLAAETLE